MKTLITALAVTAILAIPAVAKTERTRAAHMRASSFVNHLPAKLSPRYRSAPSSNDRPQPTVTSDRY
jgi:hypothetical protein